MDSKPDRKNCRGQGYAGANHYQAETILVYAHRALEYLHPNNTAYRSTATQIIGFAYYLQGDRDEADQAYTEALSLAQAGGDIPGIITGNYTVRSAPAN